MVLFQYFVLIIFMGKIIQLTCVFAVSGKDIWNCTIGSLILITFGLFLLGSLCLFNIVFLKVTLVWSNLNLLLQLYAIGIFWQNPNPWELWIAMGLCNQSNMVNNRILLILCQNTWGEWTKWCSHSLDFGHLLHVPCSSWLLIDSYHEDAAIDIFVLYQ